MQGQTQRDKHPAKHGWVKVKKLVNNSRGRRRPKRVWVQSGDAPGKKEERIRAKKKREAQQRAAAQEARRKRDEEERRAARRRWW